MDDVEREVVGLDLFTGVASVVTGLLLIGSLGFLADLWWVGVLSAAIAGGLMAASDRSRAGVDALFAGGVLAMAGVVFAVSADAGGIGPGWRRRRSWGS